VIQNSRSVMPKTNGALGEEVMVRRVRGQPSGDRNERLIKETVAFSRF